MISCSLTLWNTMRAYRARGGAMRDPFNEMRLIIAYDRYRIRR